MKRRRRVPHLNGRRPRVQAVLHQLLWEAGQRRIFANPYRANWEGLQTHAMHAAPAPWHIQPGPE